MPRIFEVVLQSTYFGVKTINRWNYLLSEDIDTGMSYALLDGFGAIYDSDLSAYPSPSVMSRISAALSTAVSFDFCNARNIFSETDFYEAPFVEAYGGQQGSQSMSPTAAYGFVSTRTNLSIRRGTKRFVGAVEEQVGAGGAIVPLMLSGPLNDIAEIMTGGISVTIGGGEVEFTPCICGKQKYEVEVDGVGTGRYAYRYYPTLAEQLAHTMTGITWSPYDTIRTQTSRQYGRGI